MTPYRRPRVAAHSPGARSGLPSLLLASSALLLLVPGSADASPSPFAPPVPAFLQDTSGALASRLARGAEFLAAGEPEKALKEYQFAVNLDPASGAAHAGVVRSYIAAGEGEKAVEAGRKAADRLPADPLVLVALGRAEFATTNYAGARDAADRALKTPDPPAEAFRVKADAVAALSPEGIPAGEAILRDALKGRPKDPDLLFELGDFLADARRTKDALPPLQAAAAGAPDRIDVRLRLARVLLAEKAPEDARTPLSEVLEKEPENAAALDLMGRSYEDGGEAATAAGYYERAVKLRPKDSLYRVDLGYALARTGKWREAERELRAALKLDDRLVEAHLHLGWVLNRQGRLKDAMDEYTAILKQTPDHLRALHNTADLLILLGKTQEAEKTLMHILSLRPNDSEAYRLLATANLDSGKAEDARKYVDKAVDCDPKNPRALLLSGRIYEEVDKFEDAEKAYRASTECDPTFAWPHLYLGELYDIYLDKPDDALKAYKRYLELGGRDEDGEIQRRIEDLEG